MDFDTPYFFSTARIEGFDGPFSSIRASLTLISNWESIAQKLSSLLRVEVEALTWCGGQLGGPLQGWSVTRVGDLIVN